MDNSWSPSLGLVGVAAVGAIGASAWCVITPDPAGRLLVGLTGLVLALAALYGMRARPRLAADPAGLVISGFGGRQRFEWSAVHRLELVHTRRFGRDVPTLEIETLPERLHVFSRLELGADPRDVADAITGLRPGN